MFLNSQPIFKYTHPAPTQNPQIEDLAKYAAGRIVRGARWGRRVGHRAGAEVGVRGMQRPVSTRQAAKSPSIA